MFRQLLEYPALVNLFLDHERDPLTGKMDFDRVHFPMFTILLEYMTSSHENIACIAREALGFGLQICALDDRLADFIVNESQLIESLVIINMLYHVQLL